MKVLHGLSGVALIVSGCGITDAPPPDPDRFVNMAVVSGGEQVGLPSTQLPDPISVRLVSTVGDKQPVRAREVRFSASGGSGLVFTPSLAITDSNGVASTHVRLGSAIGRHTIEINFQGNPGAPTTTVVEAALAPVIAQVSPAAVTANGDIVITGQSFSPQANLNEVVIDGTRAAVNASTSTRIDARVSACVPTRSANLVVRRGALESAPVRVDVTGASGPALQPALGQLVTVSGASATGCTRIAAQPETTEYIVVTQHAANSGTQTVPMRMIGLREGGGTVARPVATASVIAPKPIMGVDGVPEFRETMREREAAILQRLRMRPQMNEQQVVAASVPAVGERREFRVFVPRRPAAIITAAVRAVGKSLAIYEDIEAAGSIPQADIDRVLTQLDDPVYSGLVNVFGNATDLDRNERVVVLLTPAVNRLTTAGETSFISGYFDPCDMVSVNECSDTNNAEILYSVVPDPTGRWGLRHSVQSILRLLPPLAAHELAHLIHFNQRTFISNNRTPEDLWLSEAIAHFAEDTVAGILRGRGLTADADLFARENLIRASLFLATPHTTSLVASTGLATVEERGAGWLFLRYLHHRVGGNVIRRLMTSSQTGASSVAAVAGLSWTTLLRDWSIALFTAGTTDLAGVTLPRELTFGGFDVRGGLSTISGQTFPLKPFELSSGDFSRDWVLAPSSTTYSRLSVAPGRGVNLIVAGERGGTFLSAAEPQLLIFRIR